MQFINKQHNLPYISLYFPWVSIPWLDLPWVTLQWVTLPWYFLYNQIKYSLYKRILTLGVCTLLRFTHGNLILTQVIHKVTPSNPTMGNFTLGNCFDWII